MSLAGMDLGTKMDWTLDNGLYQRFKVYQRCIDILPGPLHAIPEENQVYYLRYWMGEEGSKLISEQTAEGKITDDEEEVTSKRKLRTYWQLFEDYTKPRSNSLIAVAVFSLALVYLSTTKLKSVWTSDFCKPLILTYK